MPQRQRTSGLRVLFLVPFHPLTLSMRVLLKSSRPATPHYLCVLASSRTDLESMGKVPKQNHASFLSVASFVFLITFRRCFSETRHYQPSARGGGGKQPE